MRYELTDLRVFMAIAKAKSLTEAASEMHLTAPSASYRLKNMEQAMGVPLFLRTQKGMELTAAGETVLRYARLILNNVESLQGEMGRYTDGVEGHIRLFANSSTLCRLPAALSRFLAAYPNVNVDLEERLSEDTVKAVLEGAADVGLIAGLIDTGDLECSVYAKDELVFAIPPRHPLGLQRKVSLGQALAHDLVSIGRKSSNFLYLAQMAARLGIKPRVRVHAHSFAAVLQCVQEGVGIALVPRSVALPLIERGMVESVELDEPWAMREQKIVVRELSALPMFAQDLVRYITQQTD
jgi:DNA-binding transcriptional LysR family regulator